MQEKTFPIHGINWIGLITLYKREVWRFLKVWNQAVFAPIITALLFLAILTLALGGSKRMVGDIPFDQFIAPGLIMMAIVQNAFANTSSSLMLSKIQGVIIDILMPPLTGSEITTAYVLGGITRGFLVGICASIALYVFVPITIYSPGLILFYIFFSSMLMALLGILGGIYAQTFDQMSAFTNYIITPLSFLSGTFYSIHQLPEFWKMISLYNPFFYMIDGFRYAITGHADGSIEVGIAVLLISNLILTLLVRHLITSGWRLKT